MTRVATLLVVLFACQVLMAEPNDSPDLADTDENSVMTQPVDSPPFPALPSTEDPIGSESDPSAVESGEMTSVQKIPTDAIADKSLEPEISNGSSIDRLAELEAEVASLKEQLSLMQGVLADIASGDMSDALLGAMTKSENLQRELGSAMQGRVNLINFTGREVPVYINGVKWSAIPNESYVYAQLAKCRSKQVFPSHHSSSRTGPCRTAKCKLPSASWRTS